MSAADVAVSDADRALALAPPTPWRAVDGMVFDADGVPIASAVNFANARAIAAAVNAATAHQEIVAGLREELEEKDDEIEDLKEQLGDSDREERRLRRERDGLRDELKQLHEKAGGAA